VLYDELLGVWPSPVVEAYERAIALAGNDAERAFLTGRLAVTRPDP
jgi:predicted RNA polymerase sigma factor